MINSNILRANASNNDNNLYRGISIVQYLESILSSGPIAMAEATPVHHVDVGLSCCTTFNEVMSLAKSGKVEVLPSKYAKFRWHRLMMHCVMADVCTKHVSKEIDVISTEHIHRPHLTEYTLAYHRRTTTRFPATI